MLNKFINAGEQKQFQFFLDRMKGPFHIISIFLAHQIRNLMQIFPFYEGYDHSFLLFQSKPFPILVCLFVDHLLCLQNIDIRRSYNAQNYLVQFQGTFHTDFQRSIIVSFDKCVKSIQLLRIFMSQPLSYLSQLSPNRALLVSIQPLNFKIALIPQEINYLIDSLVVNCLDIASIVFWRHFRVVLCQIMIVNSIINEGKGYEFLFLELLFLFYWCYVFHPSCFS